MTIGIIYEISQNPLFNNSSDKYDDRLSEFVSPTEINLLCRTIKELGYSIEIIDGAEDLLKRISTIKNKCSILFNKSIGFKGLERKLIVPAICQLHQLPIVGSSAYSMTLARHKFHTNKLLKGLGFNVPQSVLMSKNSSNEISNGITFPVIVKPNHESDSLGISEDSIFYNNKDIQDKVMELQKKFNQDVIIENFISGEEWKVAIIGNEENAKAYGCCGVKKHGRPIVGSLQTRTDIVNKNLSYYKPIKNMLVQKAIKIALKIHKNLDLHDYSRIDFRLGENNKLYCMEVSTHPNLSLDSSFIKSSLQSFNSYEEIIQEIIKNSLNRHATSRSNIEV